MSAGRGAIQGGRAVLLFMVAGAALAAPAANVCAPEVLGAWKLENSPLIGTTLLQLGRDGWANVLSGPSDQPAASYEIIAQVGYAFAPTRNAKRIEFTARSGNDVFTAGRSHWDITAFSDQSLTTQAAAGEPMLWSRVVTQRYFLTLAARSATAEKPAASFVMWTTLGAKTEFEALGIRGEGTNAQLGRIPAPLAQEFTRHSGRAEDVMLRIELSEAEYHRTHRVLESWDAVLKSDRLARNDPVAQLIELLDATVQSVNRCAGRLQAAPKPARPGTAAMTNSVPLQWLRELRRLNDKRHVSDRMFPFAWKPPAVG